MKYLIAGLGNIGEEYETTRHNVGFQILDAIAKEEKLKFIPGRYVSSSEFSIQGKKIVLIKPSTFVNRSGLAVRYWLQREKIAIENLLVIVDDISLPFGTIRIRVKGSDGGHNGLKDIIDVLQTTAFPRLRFGIGNNFSKGGQVDYVLGKWTGEEKKMLSVRIAVATEAIKSCVKSGLENTMTDFNSK